MLNVFASQVKHYVAEVRHINSEISYLLAVLWALVIVLIGVFIKVEPSAGYMQLPYLAWVTFASVLNYSLLKLNTQPVSPSLAQQALQWLQEFCMQT